jgi:hypothetical protein
MFHSMGVHAWTVEIWSPQRQAGITDYKYIDWFRDHPHSHDIQLLKWSDEKLEGKGYVDWRPFEHPQLGTVEIGGWDGAYAFRNPPPPMLEAEIAPLADWAIWHAGTGPRLELRDLQQERVGDSVRLRLTVQKPAWLHSGQRRVQGPQLEGWCDTPSSGFGWHADVTDDRHTFEWLVAPGHTYQLVARHDRAGVVRLEVTT